MESYVEKEIDPRNIMPGDRVIAFDSSLFKDDKSTPLNATMRQGMVTCRYGYKTQYSEPIWVYYPDLVDIKFDHRPNLISHGHFTRRVKTI